jgi:hypothetical protein
VFRHPPSVADAELSDSRLKDLKKTSPPASVRAAHDAGFDGTFEYVIPLER